MHSRAVDDSVRYATINGSTDSDRTGRGHFAENDKKV